MTAVLETTDLVKRFGGLMATDHVTFRLEEGARHALIGPNGAGKTTFVNQLSGVLRPTAGTIRLAGADATGWSVRRRARAGLARTFQINQLFGSLSVLETLLLAVTERQDGGRDAWRPLGSRAALVDEAASLIGQLGLGGVMHARVGALPYGQQRLVEIAVALAARPRVLLLDEPAAGVPEGERGQILDVVSALPPDVALLLIEHDMDLVFRFASRISVLVNGALFAEGTPRAIADDPRVRAVYLGDDHGVAVSALENG